MRAIAAVMLLFVLAPGSALAQSLYRCVTPAGAVSIQSDPCPAGSTQVWKRDATPEPERTPEQLAAIAAQQARIEQDARALSRMAGTAHAPLEPTPAPVAAPVATPAPVVAPEPAPPTGPCRSAHEFATTARGHTWLELSDAQRYRMDEWVAQQCRDPE